MKDIDDCANASAVVDAFAGAVGLSEVRRYSLLTMG